ncbi:hypothetical protein J6590_037294 [Homalodisca vitripennis]|nr:hypothetical protein J6590_037294 [Homalodisca vitripennis]
MSDNIVNHPSELDRQLDVDLSDDDWSGVSSVFSDDTDVDPTYRPTISDSGDEEMPFSQLSTSRGNAAARPTPDNDQPASIIDLGPMPNKLPGLVTKGNMTPGYEMVRGAVSGMPGQYVNMPSPGNMLNMAYPPMGFPSNMMPPNMNPAQFLQQSLQGMGGGGDMGYPPNLSNMGALGQFLSMGNSQFLNQLLSQGMHPGVWPAMLPNKAVSNMWANEESKIREQDDEENDDEDMGVAETYADYMPPKLKLGRKHPDPVVETASLSSVEPTDVWYKLSLPEETIQTGSLSALQLEAITYASQQHEHFLPDGTRAGFLIGDGAGVGKGRTIAGCIFENFLKGRKRAIWVSVSNDLKYDSERDLKDIGASKVEVYSLNKFKYAKISSPVNGNVKKGVIFSTYSALIGESSQSGGKYKTRLKQLLQWCGDDFDGLSLPGVALVIVTNFGSHQIVFDECHRAKNLCPVGSSKPTKTGLTVLELQNKLPKARVVYASATGASEPRNMAYMTRLGMWGEGTPFPEFTDFISAVEKRGVGAMEIVAMDMKLRGMYIARQLSFHGVAFKIEEVPLSPDFVKVYDDSVSLWVEAMQRFQEAAELIDAENRMKKTMWGQFWSSHQRFFKYLCIAAKVKHAVQTARFV